MPTPDQSTDESWALVLSGDGNLDFARGLAVTLSSTLTHLHPECRPGIYVIDCGLPQAARDRLQRVVSRARRGATIRWVGESSAGILATLPLPPSHLPPVVYSRLLIADLLPATVTRALFLDGDLLVGRDLAPLFSFDLGTAQVGAVLDALNAERAARDDRPYFNAGVLLLDLPAWRTLGLSREIIEYIATHEPMTLQDQDALNLLVPDWLELDYWWNLQMGLRVWWGPERDRFAKMLEETPPPPDLVRHYTGPKPWFPAVAPPESFAWVLAYARSGWASRPSAVLWVVRWIIERALTTAKREGQSPAQWARLMLEKRLGRLWDLGVSRARP